MIRNIFFIISAGLFLIFQTVSAQPNRIKYNNQQLFLSGVNLYYVNYANDVGSSIPTDTTTFGNYFLQIHNAGGNAARWWLHIDGSVTPQFSSVDSTVIGPGSHTISDMRKTLDIAWQRAVGVNICLWAFDMLNTSNSALVLARNQKLLNDTNAIRAYINNCLIPMVDSLKGHPAILSWEIFNEPEGMSTQFGWSGVNHVDMSVIQRFINLCAGAIHRADPNALVTNGAWSFISNTDLQTPLAKISKELQMLSISEKEALANEINKHYRLSETTDQVINDLSKVATYTNENYYSDEGLKAAGGDPKGTLDFYSVHFYPTSTGPATNPFLHPAYAWFPIGATSLIKPIVIAEFPMEENLGVPKALMFDTLYQMGYAGALPWAWDAGDTTFSKRSSMISDMQYMWTNYRDSVAVNGIAVSWPSITITSPLTGVSYPDSTSLTIMTTVSDTLPISSVTLYADTTKIGTVTTPYATSSDTSFFAFEWSGIQSGSYAITAIAANSVGHQQVSNTVIVSIGLPPMTKFEAESAQLQGAGYTIKSSTSASNNHYVDYEAQDSTDIITWHIPNVQAAGTYPLVIGYMLNDASPKSQYLNVNNIRVDTVVFTAASTTSWYQKIVNVNLIQGANTIQIQMFWGYMSFDYIALPTSVVTSVSGNTQIPIVYALLQNYPNPFNPTTTINFDLPKASNVKLAVYNVLGQQVATLVDSRIEAGFKSVRFNASKLSSGVYFYRLEAGSFISNKKMLLLK